MNGEYRVKHPDLLPLYQNAKRLIGRFERVTLTHVRREQNERADEIGNEALDGRPRRRGEPPPPPRTAAPARARGPTPPKALVDDATVRDDALTILRTAAAAWADRGLSAAPVEAVWEQLWSVLEEGNVLKKKAK